MGIFYNPRIVTDGLVLCLDAGNRRSYPATGTVWTDLSGQENNGTLISSPIFSTSNLGLFQFNGTSNYITILHKNILHQTTQMTLEVFATANWSTMTGERSIISKSQNGGYGIYVNSLGLDDLTAYFYIAGSYRPVSVNRTSLISNRFYHIVATYDGQVAKLYIDGTLESTYTHPTASPITYSSNNSLMIAAEPGAGTSPQSFSFCFPGSVSSAKIYNRAITIQEVSQNFNAIRGRYGI
jgi:hypothetical protein